MSYKANLALTALLLSGLLILTGCGTADDETAETMTMETVDQEGMMVACAYDGMRMREQVMESAEYGGQTLYFCNEGHKEKFFENPDRYRYVLEMQDITTTVWIMPAEKHMDAMHDMGTHMHTMSEGHYLGVEVVHKETKEFVRNASVNLRITATTGARDIALRYDDMMGNYSGEARLPSSGSVDVEVSIEHDGISDTSTITYEI